MKTNLEWQIVFCTDCHEPCPPQQLSRYGPRLLCEDCEKDLFLNPEMFSEPAQLR